MKLWAKILLGMCLGLLLGALIGPKASYLKPVGDLFLNLIGMLILPLIFSSMAIGVTSIKDPAKLGRVGLKTLVLYLVTTATAIVLGLFFAKMLKPGVGLQFDLGGASITTAETPPLTQMLVDIVPKNPFNAFASGNVLQVIVFALFVGFSIQLSGRKGGPLLRILESLSQVMYTLTGIVMKFAPIGVFAIMASISGSFGLSILIPLAKLLGTIYLASFFQFFLVFGLILVVVCRLNPIRFFKGMIESIVLAFSTSSSSASVPVTIHCAEHNLGVPKGIANFVIPLGSTVNMNGTAIFQAVAAVFVAQMYGVALPLQSLLVIVLTATLSAVGTAGIPGAGFIILSMVLKSVGLPLEGIGIILAIDRLRDMVGTVVNVVGDAVVSVYVAQTEGELNLAQYNDSKIVALENSPTI